MASRFSAQKTRGVFGEAAFDDIVTHDTAWYAEHGVACRFGETVTRIDRAAKTVHSRNGEAYCVISIYLDERVFRLAPRRFRRETVVPVLLELPGVVIAHARQTLAIAAADVEVAGHLGIGVNAPVAEVRRIVTGADGSVLYLGEVTYRGDYIHFEMDLKT